jgi:hypothetical protein
MNILKTDLKEPNHPIPAQLVYINRALFWWAFTFALAVLLILEFKAAFHFVRYSAGASGIGSFDLFRTMGMPLAVSVLAAGAYLNVKRVVSSVSEDPAILRAITFYGLMVLGFAFLTMDLLL